MENITISNYLPQNWWLSLETCWITGLMNPCVGRPLKVVEFQQESDVDIDASAALPAAALPIVLGSENRQTLWRSHFHHFTSSLDRPSKWKLCGLLWFSSPLVAPVLPPCSCQWRPATTGYPSFRPLSLKKKPAQNSAWLTGSFGENGTSLSWFQIFQDANPKIRWGVSENWGTPKANFMGTNDPHPLDFEFFSWFSQHSQTNPD